jgi:hypothetical protein
MIARALDSNFNMKREGIPVTHKKLLRSIWGPEYGAELDYLRFT